MPVHKGIKIAAQNRKARHDYFIEDTYECGIVLQGTEVKSIRNGALNLKDSYAQVKNGELYLIGMHVSPYEQGNIYNHDPFRTRKLLAHAREIRKLLTQSQAGTSEEYPITGDPIVNPVRSVCPLSLSNMQRMLAVESWLSP